MPSNTKRLLFIVLSVFILLSCRKDARRIISPDNIVETQPAIQIPVTEKINDAIGGYYEALPSLYNTTTKSYPLLVFIPGAGQFGNGGIDLPYVLNDGPAQLLDKKKFPPAFNVRGSVYSLMVLSPQFSYYPSNLDIASFIDYAVRKYRVDKSRIYIAGLSMGGFISSSFSAEYSSMIAAAVPISGVLMTGDLDLRCSKVATGRLPLWVFHNTDDPTINSSEPVRYVSLINQNNPAIPAKLTLFKAAIHDAWTEALNPLYKEDNMNIYEWMLQYSR